MAGKLSAPRDEIVQALLGFKKAFRSVGVFSMIINLLMLTGPLYMLQVYDRVLSSRNTYTLLMITIIVVGAYIFLSALEYIRSQVVIRVGSRLDLHMNRRVYTAAFEQNLKNGNGNAGQALSDLTTIRQFVTGNALFSFFDAPWAPIYIAVIFLFNVWLGVFALVGTLILVAMAIINQAVTKKPLAEANQMSVVSGQHATNTLRNAEVIEAMGMLPNLQARWYRLHEKFLAQQTEASNKASSVSAFTRFFRLSLQSLVLGLGALLVLEGQMTAGMMIAGSILLGRALAPVEGLINVWKQWAGVKSAHGRLVKLLEQNPARKSGMELPAPTGKLSFEGVTAAPPGARLPVVRNATFALEPGDILGMIGPSGSGKSTLARLMVGVWPAMGGKVRLDGADVYQWNKDELGPHVGYLPQDIELFAGSISENIARFGSLDAAKVIAASRMAGVHDMILQFPQGYDTVIGDGGAGLSGGQRQRIALARALYGLPALIVLDEPNSNLDESGEEALRQAIAKLKEAKRTVILITHRTSIIAATTKLVLLRDGAVNMFGPTNQVLAAIAQANQRKAGNAPPAPPAVAGPGSAPPAAPAPRPA
ncbi:type I secretion system permease/ATPase [Achromobacter sp. GG226]|uniref:type I secretion system permease/ATPase n=1 Tax=Verticiella alkaliphila TaxID=2779529 RepID=UPI001C0AB9F2|nr:type I secretion system permease/ATPase [Verticiella sp. GG226]MBU4612090.1 type I secretion system permease/ATPase [Verticiella sp. GG226]